MKLAYFIITLFTFIQHNECHIKWLKDILPNFVLKELSELKKIINEDSTKPTEYENFRNYVDSQPSVHHGSEGDPSKNMTTPQLIAFHGYICESHTIITEDGYILTVHRIPHSKKGSYNNISSRNTILLHHGLLGSSADWIIPGPDKGLAYILSDAGHDVWMANARGNVYSRAHISFSKSQAAFWNFTFHEISQYDLPAVMDYIVCKKGSDVKLSYVGHSMGTTVLFALLSTKTHYNNVLAAGFALAPVTFMTEIRSPVRLMAKYSDKTEFLRKLFGNEFLPKSIVYDWLSNYACADCDKDFLCENFMLMICGPNSKDLNQTLLPTIFGHTPAGTSSKTIIHYAQEVQNEGRFQQFDYGIQGNIKAYGTFGPPEYNLTKITLPIALFSSKNDWLAGDGDVSILSIKISDLIEHYVVPVDDFNHLDFLWAQNAPNFVYDKLLQLLKEIEAQISFTLR